MFIESVLKRQLKKYDYEFFIDEDLPDTLLVFVGCRKNSVRARILRAIAEEINSTLRDKGQYIECEESQGFMNFSFHKP